ncbi:MAG: hypothetical protein JST11_03775 [Acidobacteria bacterium]|nr:hypothetical protein [Acidobacteriota bacterium]
MRIAVPTNDELTVSPHFGRSAAFLVFETCDGAILNRELRPNGAAHHHDHSQEHHQPHNHAEIVATLAGCDLVLCAGIGHRAADALKSAGIATVVAGPAGSPEDTVRAYLDGTLPKHAPRLCRCSH